MSLIGQQKILKLSLLAFFSLTLVTSPPSPNHSFWEEEGMKSPLWLSLSFLFDPWNVGEELTSLEVNGLRMRLRILAQVKKKLSFAQNGAVDMGRQNTKCPSESSSPTSYLMQQNLPVINGLNSFSANNPRQETYFPVMRLI